MVNLVMDNYQLVSIVLLTYNHEKYIKDCILGILEQDYTNIELIILDDASNDRTVKIIKSLQNKLIKRFVNFIFLENNKNSGNIAYNINCMIKKCKGNYIKIISGDDIMEYNCVSKLLMCFTVHPECSVVYSNVYIVSNDYKKGNTVTKTDKMYNLRKSELESKAFFRKLMLGNCIAAPSVMTKKDVYEKWGFYDESIPYEDYEYWIRVSYNGGIFYYLNECLVYYRRSCNSMTNFTSKGKKNRIKVAMISDGKTIKKYLMFLSKHEQIKCIKMYYNRYLKITREAKFWRAYIVLLYRLLCLKVSNIFN